MATINTKIHQHQTALMPVNEEKKQTTVGQLLTDAFCETISTSVDLKRAEQLPAT